MPGFQDLARRNLSNLDLRIKDLAGNCQTYTDPPKREEPVSAATEPAPILINTALEMVQLQKVGEHPASVNADHYETFIEDLKAGELCARCSNRGTPGKPLCQVYLVTDTF